MSHGTYSRLVGLTVLMMYKSPSSSKTQFWTWEFQVPGIFKVSGRPQVRMIVAVFMLWVPE